MSCGTTIRVLFSRALSHPKHSRPWLCRGRGCRGGRRERTHTANSMRVGRQVVRGWTFGRSQRQRQTLIQRAILCLSQQCSASGARWLASSTTTGANLQCGRTLAGGARGRSWSMSRITRALCVCMQQGRYIAHKFENGWEVGVIKAFDKEGPHAGKFSVKYKDDPNWWTHSLLREGYGKDNHWVLLRLLSRDSASSHL